MAKIVKPAARTRRPKAEIEQEFSAVEREVAAASAAADPKADELERLREAETLASVGGVSVESVVGNISSLGLEISKALASVSGRLVEEVERLAAVREAVRIEQAELARLHKIDVAATALDQLVAEHARQRAEFDADMARQRSGWSEETKATERERKEQEEALRRQRQREIEEYEYKKTQERKKAQDKYDEEQRQVEKKNREKQEALEKSWEQREASLKEQEVELARLKKEVDTFPARLQKEIDQSAARAAQAADARFEQQAALLRKDQDAERRVAELEIRTLRETVAQQAAQVAALQSQLEEAKRQVQEIAVKAIEGASGARALAHVNQIAMEQAKPRTQN
jgi:colicin import membrane protein